MKCVGPTLAHDEIAEIRKWMAFAPELEIIFSEGSLTPSVPALHDTMTVLLAVLLLGLSGRRSGPGPRLDTRGRPATLYFQFPSSNGLCRWNLT